MNKIFNVLSSIVLIFLFFACARIGVPPGGEKDEEPPKVIKSKPANYSTNYNRKNIYIGFDEFITLKNVFTEFTISPPLEEPPAPLLKGKGIVVDLLASSLDSLTYTLDFGQSIADNNEGNLLPNFQFVLTKQTHIDSFSISGKILDSYTHKPDKEGLFIYLYNQLSDTIPYTTIPSYLGRTTPTGEFKINHIAPGTYAVFALKDANANMLFDLSSEIIGFTNEPVYLYADSFPSLPDTIFEKPIIGSEYDSLIVENKGEENTIQFELSDSLTEANIADTSQADSIEFMVYGYSLNLYSFIEPEPIKQYLVEYKRRKPEKLELVFNSPLDSLPEFVLLNPDTIDNWYLLESNSTLDTLIYWLPDSILINNDSIIVALIHPETDTTDNLVIVSDTLLFRLKAKKEKVAKKNSKRKIGKNLPFGKNDIVVDTISKSVPRMDFRHNINISNHDLFLPIVFTSETPVFEYKPELIELFRLEDTIERPTKFQFVYDSSEMRKSTIKIDFEPATNYILKLHESVFTDIYNRTIDSTIIKFQTQRDDYYGIIDIQMQNITKPTILQLLNTDESLVKQIILYNDKKISFDFLKPGKYKLKVIIDENDNGHWDTGIYKLKLQPEGVAYFPTEPEVKSNWTIDYEWKLK